MTKEELNKKLNVLLPELEFPEINSSYLNVRCNADYLMKSAETLKNDPEFQFDFLFSLTAIDWPEDMEVVYHLRSSKFDHELVLRVKLPDRGNPQVPTVSKIWPTAEFHEREVYDLFGVNFMDHPDLRRIFLDDDWVGHPLRKDYTDEVNMVDL